jgi:protein MYSM1
VTDEWTDVNTDMDDESRKLIEQMLAEEEYYYGNDSLSTATKSKPTTVKKRKEVIKDSDYDLDHDSATSSMNGKRSKKEGMNGII